MPRPDATATDNTRAALWLFADMGLNVVAIVLVKSFGGTYPAMQVVFLRAVIGLALLLPWVGQVRLRLPERPGLHALRVGLSAVALSGTFQAAQALPLALFTTLNFTRPLVLMLLAWLLLGERIAWRRWAVAGVGFLGVAIATGPGGEGSIVGLVAVALAVLAGTGAVIVTRQLKGAGTLTMMALYTGGIAVLTAPFAVAAWVPVAPVHWPWLLAVGVFAQAAQACFLRAHWAGEAGFLGPLGYLSLVVSTAAGYVAFGEVPGWRTAAGAVVIVGAALALTERRKPQAVAATRPAAAAKRRRRPSRSKR